MDVCEFEGGSTPLYLVLGFPCWDCLWDHSGAGLQPGPCVGYVVGSLFLGAWVSVIPAGSPGARHYLLGHSQIGQEPGVRAASRAADSRPVVRHAGGYSYCQVLKHSHTRHLSVSLGSRSASETAVQQDWSQSQGCFRVHSQDRDQ